MLRVCVLFRDVCVYTSVCIDGNLGRCFCKCLHECEFVTGRLLLKVAGVCDPLAQRHIVRTPQAMALSWVFRVYVCVGGCPASWSGHMCFSVCQRGSFQCALHPCASTCTAYGDRHYRTFDGLPFDFVGACKVHLVKVSSWRCLMGWRYGDPGHLRLRTCQAR